MVGRSPAMSPPSEDLELRRRRGEVCEWCARRSVYVVYLGQGEVQAACEEHQDRLRGGAGPDPAAKLRGDVGILVERHGLGAVLGELARRVQQHEDRRG